MVPKQVHPQIAAVIAASDALGQPKVAACSVAQARAQVRDNLARLLAKFPACTVGAVDDLHATTEVGDIPLRLYRPAGPAQAPTLIYFHGGGHVFGDLASHDHVCRSLCRRADAVVISVDYPLAPEDPFPAAPEASYAALRWIADQADQLGIDRARLVVGGDSAGGNLATVVALMARDRGGPALTGQMLIYPVVDYRGGTESFAEFATGYGILEADTVDWFADHYLPVAADRDDWRAAPHLAQAHAGLPPALVLLAECDVLYSEGAAYARQLQAAGVDVKTVEYPGMIHAFFGLLGPVDAAAQAHDDAAGWLRGV